MVARTPNTPENQHRGGGGAEFDHSLIQNGIRPNRRPNEESRDPSASPSPAHLELPVGRLQELLRLIGGAAGRQNKLVDHDLVPQFVHIHRHGRSVPEFKRNKKKIKRKLVASSPRNRQTHSSLRVCPGARSLSSAAFNSNNNIFMSSPTTKRSGPLIGRLRQRDTTTAAPIGCPGDGFKFTGAFVFLPGPLPMSGAKADSRSLERLDALPWSPCDQSTCFYSRPLR